MDINELTQELARGGYGRREVSVGDKFVLVAKVESEDISAADIINDADCWGKVAWGRRNRDTGREERPQGFTGAACKVYASRSDVMWWEPYRDEDAVYNSPEARREVERLLEEGFYYVALDVLELCTVSGSDGRHVGERFEEVSSHSIGCVDTDDFSYLSVLFGDLLSEAGIDQEWLDTYAGEV